MSIKIDRDRLALAIAALTPLAKTNYPHPLAEVEVKYWQNYKTFNAARICISGFATDGWLWLTICGDGWKASTREACEGEGGFIVSLNHFVGAVNKSSATVLIEPMESGIGVSGWALPSPRYIQPVSPVTVSPTCQISSKALRKVAKDLKSPTPAWVLVEGQDIVVRPEGGGKVCLETEGEPTGSVFVNLGDVTRAALFTDDLERVQAAIAEGFVLFRGRVAIQVEPVPTDELPPGRKVVNLTVVREAVVGEKRAIVHYDGSRYILSVWDGEEPVEAFLSGLKMSICRKYTKESWAISNLERWEKKERGAIAV